MLKELWSSLSKDQIVAIEKAYAERVKSLKSEGQDVEDLTAYESLEKYEDDDEDITSYEDIMDILR